MLIRRAVIGNPIAHSLSPVLHNAGYAALGLHDSFITHRVTSLDSQWDELDIYDGLAVTMPWKQEVRKHCDVVEDLALAVDSINTVVHSGGLTTGFNTDVYGISAAISHHAQDRAFSSMVILGGRASASSALAASAELGRPRVTVAARTLAGPGTIMRAATRLGVSVMPIAWQLNDAIRTALSHADLVVSTVPSSIADHLCEGLVPRQDAVLLEASYMGGSSRLQQCFQQVGATIVPGTDMLYYQALQQFCLFTGKEAPAQAMREALDKALSDTASTES